MERQTIVARIEESAHHFLIGMKAQYSETKDTAVIIEKYIKVGSLTPEEEKMLKSGLVNSLKMAGVVIPFVMVPGASILMPILIKVAAKHNIELLPPAFSEHAKTEKDAPQQAPAGN